MGLMLNDAVDLLATKPKMKSSIHIDVKKRWKKIFLNIKKRRKPDKNLKTWVNIEY